MLTRVKPVPPQCVGRVAVQARSFLGFFLIGLLCGSTLPTQSGCDFNHRVM